MTNEAYDLTLWEDDGGFIPELDEPPKEDGKQNMLSSSEKLWEAWHRLFDFFNDELFSSELDRDRIILNCSRSAGRSTLGFYMGLLQENRGAWIQKDGDEQKAEISMNPAKMAGFSFEKIMATFVHEMCHFWQDLFGSSGKRGYHNREWAEKMLEVGLTPINNKDPSKTTGMSMYHKITENGRFSQVIKKLPEELRLPFLGLNNARPSKKTGYQKWICPECKQICRAKDSAQLACMPCSKESFVVGKNEFISLIPVE